MLKGETPSAINECPSNIYFILYLLAALYNTCARAISVGQSRSGTLALKKDLNTLQSDLLIYFDTPLEVFKKLTEKYTINHVFTNHDYEPYAKKRDEEIAIFLKTKNII